ncbi:MAG: hypothetical protein ACREQB_01040 [Candidatus Binataceae bacterium]
MSELFSALFYSIGAGILAAAIVGVLLRFGIAAWLWRYESADAITQERRAA